MNEAPKKIKISILQSAQSRVFLALGLIVVVVAAIAFIIHWRSNVDANQASASVSGVPGISSTPGAGDPSAAYVAAQNQANAQGEQEARKTATAYVPTITRAGFVGNPDQFGQTSGATDTITPPGQCPLNKTVVMYKPNPASCDPDNLKKAKEAGVTAEELLCQGCACPGLKLAGFTVGDLKQVGLSAEQLHACGFNLQELMSAGFSAGDLKAAGFSANELKSAGFTAGELKAAGFSANELKSAGFSASQLKDAGFNASELKTAGFSNADLSAAGFSAAEIQAADAGPAQCSMEKLKEERAAGISAANLKAQGCGVAALKAAGFSAAELKQAGFSATALKTAGFSDAELNAAGFSPAEIQAADTATALCSLAEIKHERAAGSTAAELKAKGCGAAALKEAGFTAAELKAAGYSAQDLKEAGFSAAQLKDAGFTAKDAGFADDSGSCNIEKLKQERADGVSATALRQQGCGLAALKAAGFTAAALRTAGFSAGELKAAGFSAQDLKDAGFSAAELKSAGFSASELKAAGFSAAALKSAGFSAGQLVSAGFSPKELRTAGFSAEQLHHAGVSASALREAGFGINALRAAGFTKGDLLRAGFSSAEAGYEKPEKSDQLANANESESASTAAPAGTELPSISGNSSEARLAQFEKQQQAEENNQQKRDHIQRMEVMMTQQSQTLMSGWGTVSTQSLQKAPDTTKSKSDGENGSGSDGKKGSKSGSAANEGPTIKAGSVLFAVIDTSIDSDEDTPIMARIVAGDLNGSKLLGTFTRKHKKLLITFTMLSSPDYPKSIALNAVAIDPNTARTAIDGRVNSHYLLRYGTLFASSFLQGMSQGIMNQGVSSDCLFGGFGCTLKPTPLSVNQQIAVGLGQVGTAYSQHMGQSFNRPPTIRIGAGTGVGVLLMSDLTLPTNKSSGDPQ